MEVFDRVKGLEIAEKREPQTRRKKLKVQVNFIAVYILVEAHHVILDKVNYYKLTLTFQFKKFKQLSF